MKFVDARSDLTSRGLLLALMLVATLSACSGSGDRSTGSVVAIEAASSAASANDPGLVPGAESGSGSDATLVDTSVTDSGGTSASAGAGLRVDSTRLCPVVGDTFNLPVSAVAADDLQRENPDSVDVSATVMLNYLYGDALELLARGDETISLRMTRPDIVGLRADLEGGSSLTVYIAGFPVDTPASVLMRKLVPGGCLYGLRLDDVNFCGTARSNGVNSVQIGSGDRYVEITGCDYTPIEGVPVIERPADNSG